MGTAGTDIALETADIALMADDLAKLPVTIRFAREADRKRRRVTDALFHSYEVAVYKVLNHSTRRPMRLAQAL